MQAPLAALASRRLTGPRQRPPGRSRQRPLSRLGRVRAHWPLLVLLGAGAVVRGLTFAAVSPGNWFPDSYTYLHTARTGVLSTIRPGGYSLLVALVGWTGQVGALIALQHVIGLALPVVVYALLRHRGAPRWLGTLAAVPLTLDGYVIALEHYVMAETMFDALLVTAVAVLLWRHRPRVSTCGFVGLILGLAGVTRTVGLPLIVLFAGYLLLRRMRPLAAIALFLGWGLVVGGYASLYDAQHGSLALGGYSGRFLYGRVAPFADCSRFTPDRVQRGLCQRTPSAHRPGINHYLWGATSPAAGLRGPGADAELSGFARQVIRHQPATYLASVAENTAGYFEPVRGPDVDRYPVDTWRFPTTDPTRPVAAGWRGPIRVDFAGRGAEVHTSRSVSQVLHGYQLVVYSYGPLLLACLLLSFALALRGRRGREPVGSRESAPSGRRGRAPLGSRLDGPFVALVALACLVVAAATSVFDYRYAVPAVALLPLAAGLSWVSRGTPAIPAGRVGVPGEAP